MFRLIQINSPELNKRAEELDLAYIWRIGQMYDGDLLIKEDGATKADWNDLCKLFNSQLRVDDEEWTEAAYRKPYQNAVKYYNAVFKRMNKSKGYLSELEIKQQQLQKERYKLQATKLEMNRNLRQESRFDLFYENVKEAIISLEPPVFERINILPASNKEWVLGFGDIHYGSNFNSQNNIYSRQESQRRFEYLLSNMRRLISENNIQTLKIINAADTIQGILRMTDFQINDIPIVECVVEISRLLAEFLNQLSALCFIEYYHCSASNHGQIRPLGSKANEIAAEDMEKIIVNYISDLLINNNRVKVISELDKEYLSFDIFGFKTVILHGHQIKSVCDIVKDLSNLHRVFYDYVFLGHRHSANEIIAGEGAKHNIEILTIPSFIGSDPYADKLMVGSKAMAKLYEFDSVNGHTGSKNIILN